MVIEDTKEANEVNDPREVSKREDNPDGIEKTDDEGTQTRSSKRQKESNSVGRQR